MFSKTGKKANRAQPHTVVCICRKSSRKAAFVPQTEVVYDDQCCQFSAFGIQSVVFQKPIVANYMNFRCFCGVSMSLKHGILGLFCRSSVDSGFLCKFTFF